MDRNNKLYIDGTAETVALRKESVDRNLLILWVLASMIWSLSARRAWIEIILPPVDTSSVKVALRKESVDRNFYLMPNKGTLRKSLSARRAWIEI